MNRHTHIHTEQWALGGLRRPEGSLKSKQKTSVSAYFGNNFTVMPTGILEYEISNEIVSN